MIAPGLPERLRTFVQREFMGERLVWAARPDVRSGVLAAFAIYIFAIPWTAFSLFWISVPLGALYEFYEGANIGAPKGAPIGMMWVFALFGAPFVLIGFGMLSAPFWVFWKGRQTLYVLTDKRLTTLQGASTITVASLSPREIGALTRKEKTDGRGTLVISHGYERDSDGDRIERKTTFGVIDDVRGFERMVRALKEREPPDRGS